MCIFVCALIVFHKLLWNIQFSTFPDDKNVTYVLMVGLGRTCWVDHSCKLERVNEFYQCLTLLFSSVFLFCPSVLFYQAQTEHPGDSAHSHRWTSLELVKGTYSTDDSPSDIAEIRLDKAVPLKVLRILHMNHTKHKLLFGTNSLPPCCFCRRM